MAAKNLVYVDERGVRQLQNAAAKMKASGQSKELTKMLNKRIRVATKPIETDLKNAAKDLTFVSTSRRGGSRGNRSGRTLKSGKFKRGRGLREEMQFGIKTRVDKGVNSAGVRILEAHPKTEVNRIARAINSKGQVRHPLFGNKDHWYMTKTTNGQGWFDKTGQNKMPQVRASVNAVVVDFTNEIARKIK
jgi:hypothetical protein